jgi:hypothetical protein
MASRLQDVILRGTLASRPVATAVAPGTLYFSTDTIALDRSDGTTWQTYSSAVINTLLDRVGQTDIVNTTAETDLYSFSVPASTLGTTRSLRLLIDGDQLNNSGSTDTVTLKIKYGATTLYEDTATYVTNATRISWKFIITLGNTTATNAQYVSAGFFASTRGGATTGNGDFNANGIQNTILSGTSTEDSTTTLTYKVTIQHSVANAATSWRRQFASLSLI